MEGQDRATRDPRGPRLGLEAFAQGNPGQGPTAAPSRLHVGAFCPVLGVRSLVRPLLFGPGQRRAWGSPPSLPPSLPGCESTTPGGRPGCLGRRCAMLTCSDAGTSPARVGLSCIVRIPRARRGVVAPDLLQVVGEPGSRARVGVSPLVGFRIRQRASTCPGLRARTGL